VALTVHLRLDPIACDGHGVCAELFPERIELDDWGYPIVDGSRIPERMLGDARRAVFACPVLALKLVEDEPSRAGRA
jgi:ferredoxin